MASSTSRPRRTVHPTISYREESTDDENTSALPIRSSQRLRRASRRDSSSDDESNTLEELPARTIHRSRAKITLGNAVRSIRSTRRVKNINYNEDSDQDSSECQPEVAQNTRPAAKAAKNKRGRPSSNPVLNSGAFNLFKRRKVNQHKSSNIEKSEHAAVPPTLPEKIPPWQTLPYQILLSILQYASYPFYRDASHDTGSIAWLIGISLLSKSLHDAAIATLLYSPPLFPAERAHGLQRLLDAPEETLSTTYRNKVKRLDIEVRNLLIKKSGIDLINLVKQTSLLKALHLYHNYDRVGAVTWAQPSAARGKTWSYPLELFEAFDNGNIRLQEWSWNGRFPDTKSVVDQMKDAHSRDCLKGLKSLSLLNLATPEKAKDEERGSLEDSLTIALKSLPNLQELMMENCSLVNTRVLASLPSQLRHLSIINCGNFNSADFRLYLAEHGYELQELVLRGDQALDLGFSTALESLCPNLRRFEMDLSYSDPTAFHDVDPHFEGVFPDGIMPTWPRTLQIIKIENLRNLDAEDAESFLSSLIAVAPELKDLRKVSIRILLQDDGWRERAKLRQTWMPKLEDVFLRRAPPPEPFVPPVLRRPSLLAMNTLSRPSTSHSTSSTSFNTDDSTTAAGSATSNKRKSARIAKRELETLANTNTNHYLPNPNRSKKIRAAASNKDNHSDEDHDPEQLVQALCSEVILHIDGQRPADEQFKETDFLDDELSGDEEWNGRDVDVAGGRGYAW